MTEDSKTLVDGQAQEAPPSVARSRRVDIDRKRPIWMVEGEAWMAKRIDGVQQPITLRFEEQRR
ncbi:MAG: hypothetical protein AAGA90_24055, partial [Actinomycetota bacterium]